MNLPEDFNNSNSYTPWPWLKNQHLMTLAAAFLPVDSTLGNNQALIIPVSNDSSVLAHAHLDRTINRCLTLVHGLEGSSESIYICNLAAKAIAAGFNVVRLNLRNCGNTLHLTPTLYNAGQSADLIKVIYWLKDNFGQSEQYVVGYSLGGNLVLKALAELGGPGQPVKAGCSVSPSIDLAASVECLGTGISRIYDYVFLHSLKKKIVLKNRLFPERYDLNKLKRVNNMRDFDQLFTAPDQGYDTADDYYRAASSMNLINHIKINTLIITAKDDPLVPYGSFEKINNPHVKVLAPDHGGHVSFLGTDNTFSDGALNSLWSDSQIISFCRQQSKLKEAVLNV